VSNRCQWSPKRFHYAWYSLVWRTDEVSLLLK
jgi:hypothetical protein